MLIFTGPNVLESKSPTMLIAKMITPVIPEGKGDVSRELGRGKVRDQ